MKTSSLVTCPKCGKEMKSRGLSPHMRFMHSDNSQVVADYKPIVTNDTNVVADSQPVVDGDTKVPIVPDVKSAIPIVADRITVPNNKPEASQPAIIEEELTDDEKVSSVWINCNDGLPDNRLYKNVTINSLNGRYCSVGFFRDNLWWRGVNEPPYPSGIVVSWRELPPPYEG